MCSMLQTMVYKATVFTVERPGGRGTLTQRFRHIQGAGLKTEDLVVKSELKQTQDRDR